MAESKQPVGFSTKLNLVYEPRFDDATLEYVCILRCQQIALT